MDSIKLERISCADSGASQKLADLRARLGAQGSIISPKSRQLTMKVFGEALSPAQVVERICNDVRKEGVAAVLRYTEHFDVSAWMRPVCGSALGSFKKPMRPPIQRTSSWFAE